MQRRWVQRKEGKKWGVLGCLGASEEEEAHGATGVGCK